MSDNSGEVPGQDADSPAAQRSARPVGSEPAQASTPEEPDEEIHKGDQPKNSETPREDEKEEGHGKPDGGVSETDEEKGRKAFDRVAEVLMQDEVINEETQATMEKAINEIEKWCPEQLDRIINDYRDTALHMAAYKDLPRAFNALLKARKSLKNTTNEGGSTPLHVACSRGHIEIIRSLLTHDADITLANYDGWTPFITAVANGHENVAQLLLDERGDIDVDHADDLGMTPLHHAACGSDPLELVPFLIGKNADISKKDNGGSTPLDLACFNGNEDGVQSLITNSEDPKIMESQDNNGWTPLITASRAGFSKIVEILLDHLDPAGDLLNQGDKDEDTPLHFASRYGQKRIVDILLESNADHSKQNANGQTPLHMACLYDFEDAKSEEEKSLPESCETASQLGATDERAETWFRIAESLLKDGADPSTRTNQGNSALHIVAQHRNSAWISKIMENLEPKYYSEKNEDGKTALQIAVEREDSGAILALLKRLGNRECDFANREKAASTLAFEMSSRSKDIREALLDFYRVMNPRSARVRQADWKALEWAAREGHPMMLWEVLVLSPATREMKGRIKLLLDDLEKKKKQEEGGGEKNAETKMATDGKRNRRQNTEKPTKGVDAKGAVVKKDDRRLIEDILRNPPTGTPSTQWGKLGPLDKPTNPHDLRHMDAVLLEFFVNGKKSWFHQRTGTVEDVIYSKGPQRIMNDLKERLRGVSERSKLHALGFQQGQLEKPSGRKFTWIHLPANNIKWMKDLTKRVWSDKNSKMEKSKVTKENVVSSEKPAEETKDETTQAGGYGSEPKVEGGKYVYSRGTQTGDDRQERSINGRNPPERKVSMQDKFNTAMWFFNTSWRQLPENPSEKRFMRPTCKRLRDSAEAPGDTGNLTALYMPYLRFSTEIDPDEIGAAGEIGETKVGETEAEETEAERLHKVHQARNRHKEFLETHRDDIVHGSRTLDEFYYQHLLKSGNGHEPADESSKEKQEDENRQQKQDRFAKDLENRNMNQVTSRYFYGDKIKNGGHWDILRVDQLWMWIIDDETIVTSSTHSVDGTRDPVLDSVLGFLSKQTDDPRLQGQASNIDIQKLSRKIVQVCCNFYDEAWRDFAGRTESVRHIFANAINEIAIRETDLFQKYQKAANTTGDAKAEFRQDRLDKMKDDIVMSSKLFYEIKDTSDELKILLELATRQKEVQAEMCGEEAMGDCKAENIVDDLKEKISLASKIRGAVQTTLSLQQSKLSILHNELSIEQNEAAQRQGETLMAFTIITILFLPASFLSSLFALDFASFLDTPGWAFIYIGATFLVMAVPIALLYRASLAEKFREWAKELRKWAKERQESKTAFVRFLAKMLLRAVPGEKSSSKDGAASENDGQKRKYPSNDGVAAENDGQKKIAPSKDGAAAENKAGGGLGGEDKPPGDDSQQVAEADMQVGQGKTPAQAMMMSINGANGEAVPDVGPRRRSWIKRLFRGDQVSDRGPEA